MDITLDGDRVLIDLSVEEAQQLAHALQHSEPFQSGSESLASMDEQILSLLANARYGKK